MNKFGLTESDIYILEKLVDDYIDEYISNTMVSQERKWLKMKIWETRVYDDDYDIEERRFTKQESAISYLVQEYEQDGGTGNKEEIQQLYNDYIATHNEDILDKLIRYLDNEYYIISEIEVIED